MKHLFIRVLSHTLNNDEDEEPNILEQIVRSSSPEPFELEDKVEALPKYPVDNTPRSSGFASRLSNKLKLPHRSGTIEPGGYDVENVDVTKAPACADYGTSYATYVCPLLPFPLLHVATSFPPPPQKQGYKVDKTVLKLMQELKEGGRVNVIVKPVCIFLFKDGGCDRDRVRRCYLMSPPVNRYRHFDPS